MRIFFHPDAKKEFMNAIRYYNDCKKGLGLEFAKEVYLTVERIKKFPNAWSKLSKNTRRCLVNRFPYGVIYSIKEDRIIILAIMQLNKKPDYWKNRE